MEYLREFAADVVVYEHNGLEIWFLFVDGEFVFHRTQYPRDRIISADEVTDLVVEINKKWVEFRQPKEEGNF